MRRRGMERRQARRRPAPLFRRYWRRQKLAAFGDDFYIKEWFRLRDTYGVEVAEGHDEALILAVTAAVDITAHPTR